MKGHNHYCEDCGAKAITNCKWPLDLSKTDPNNPCWCQACIKKHATQPAPEEE